MSESEKYSQGYTIEAQDGDFLEAMEAAVDYRGDTTIEVKDGKVWDGYLFNYDEGEKALQVYPKDDPSIVAIPVTDVVKVSFTGKDTASGKSWEAWAKKKGEEREKIKAQEVDEDE